MGLACLLIIIALILFIAKSKIPNAELERLANITSIVIFIFGVISLILPLPKLDGIELFQKQPTAVVPTPTVDNINSDLSVYNVSLTIAPHGCELKELVANFDAGETLSVQYEFSSGFFSKPYPGHVSFVIKGADFEKDFRIDETLTYSLKHAIITSGEYRVGIIWRGAYVSEVKVTLPNKNWQIVVSECSEN